MTFTFSAHQSEDQQKKSVKSQLVLVNTSLNEFQQALGFQGIKAGSVKETCASSIKGHMKQISIALWVQ